MRHA